MKRHIWLLLTTLAATTILSAAINTATAQRLELSNQQTRIRWSSLQLTNTISANSMRCAVTLEGSFHNRTNTKTPNSLVGYISRAAVQNNQCTGGRVTFL